MLERRQSNCSKHSETDNEEIINEIPSSCESIHGFENCEEDDARVWVADDKDTTD